MSSISIIDFLTSGSFGPIALGCSKADVLGILGEPDLRGGTSRKHRQPSIFRYGDIEFHFGHQEAAPLWLIHFELELGPPNGGPSLPLSPWILDAALSLDALRSGSVGHFPVEATPWVSEPGAFCVVTPGGVSLIFLAREGSERLAIVEKMSATFMKAGSS
jgi:hypothetical protein